MFVNVETIFSRHIKQEKIARATTNKRIPIMNILVYEEERWKPKAIVFAFTGSLLDQCGYTRANE